MAAEMERERERERDDAGAGDGVAAHADWSQWQGISCQVPQRPSSRSVGKS